MALVLMESEARGMRLTSERVSVMDDGRDAGCLLRPNNASCPRQALARLGCVSPGNGGRTSEHGRQARHPVTGAVWTAALSGGTPVFFLSVAGSPQQFSLLVQPKALSSARMHCPKLQTLGLCDRHFQGPATVEARGPAPHSRMHAAHQVFSPKNSSGGKGTGSQR